MDKQQIIEKIACQMKEKFANEGSGHDWSHIYRVWKMSQRIAKEEKADLFVVELAALLHDIADWKFYNGDDRVGPQKAKELLAENNISQDIVKHVCNIIAHISYKGAEVKNEINTIEGQVVQDADRLDAIGAIGISRAFAYGGSKNRRMHDPETKPVLHKTKKEYMNSNGTTINHFYEKLLLLKDRMNTQSAKKIASERHEFMEKFLDRFYLEWEGKA